VVHRSFELHPNAPAATDIPAIDMLATKYGVSRVQAEAMEARVAEAAPRRRCFFVIDRRYGISGGQPAAVFREALERAYADGAALLGAAGDAGVCGDDGCAVPGK